MKPSMERMSSLAVMKLLRASPDVSIAQQRWYEFPMSPLAPRLGNSVLGQAFCTPLHVKAGSVSLWYIPEKDVSDGGYELDPRCVEPFGVAPVDVT